MKRAIYRRSLNNCDMCANFIEFESRQKNVSYSVCVLKVNLLIHIRPASCHDLCVD